MNRPYLPRVIDPYLNEMLGYSGAVLIEGVKWCGKTRTAKEHAASEISLLKKSRAYAAMAADDPSILLEGRTPHLIDEWQVVPEIWNAVKQEVDERGGVPGQFILTGSAAPPDDPMRHSGAGRISRVIMRPMSLFESADSNGTVALRSLFDGRQTVKGQSELTIRKLSEVVVRGGWPDLINQPEAVSMRRVQEYVDSIINTDMSKMEGVRRSPTIVRELMRSISRNISSAANMSTIKKDMAGYDVNISEKTISSYINALRRIFIIEDVPAWNPSMRSQTAVRASPKRHFVDPSIAVAVMRASPSAILEDFDSFGFLFESLCVRDLRIYSQVIDGEVFHYRDRYGLEADAVVHLKDGRWGAVEIKLGSKEVEKGAENLKKLRERVDTDRMKEPSFLMVLTATDYAYERKDGVYVVPIGCLRD
jgi:predicted AAA+ superfamily ATPase